ncbi:MAG TPA: biopolymer transporter ExbD [Blastocatellia bacterium]|nr:biopolymer transporter ExbD [Blastocatellia bacterium]
MGPKLSGSGAKPEINLTPLIDVLLVLLIIFMVISPISPKQLEAKVPQPPPLDEGTSVQVRGLLVVSIAPGTLELSLNGTAMQVDQLRHRLTEELQRRPLELRTVFVKAPKTVLYRDVVRIIDLAKGAGAEPTGLQIDNLED